VIFEAIAAIKVANEAIGAVKELIGNVESIGQIGGHLTKLTDAKDELQKKADEGDLDAFMQLEEIRKQEYQIKQMMIYQGRPGLWDDWQKFQQTRRELREKARQRELAKIARRKRLIKDWCIGIAVSIGVLTAVGIAVYILYWLITTKGR
jgi:hypothetical protein